MWRHNILYPHSNTLESAKKKELKLNVHLKWPYVWLYNYVHMCMLPGQQSLYIAVAHVFFSCSTSVRDCWKRAEQSLIGVPVTVAMRPATTITTAFHSMIEWRNWFLDMKLSSYNYIASITIINFVCLPKLLLYWNSVMLSMHNNILYLLYVVCVPIPCICCLPLVVSTDSISVALLVLHRFIVKRT